MEHGTEPTGDLHLPADAAAQFSYHVRMAAVFAVAGATEESASEAVLAWTILASCWDGAASAALATATELVGQHQAPRSPADRDAARARADALAHSLEAHYVSVGLHADAALYAQVTEHLDTTVGMLANSA